jgi:hypothetical protein
VIPMRHSNIVAAVLLFAVTLSLLWSILHADRPAPTMISNFETGSRRCAVPDSASDAMLRIARRSDAHAETRLVVDGPSIRVSSRIAVPTRALFDEQGRTLADLLNCGTSEWCEGRGSDDQYGAAQLPLLPQKRRGENVKLPGCELTESDFHPVSFEIVEAPGPRLDVFVVFSIVINVVAIFLVMRGGGAWSWRRD